MTTINQILIGGLAPLGPRAIPSGICKYPVKGRVFLGREGLAGDAQGDRQHHGGPDKAVHHYAFDHYAHWLDAIGQRAILNRPGAFGENLSTDGLTEDEAALGDTFRVGEAVIQISQGRQPCWKLNERFGVSDMALLVQRIGLTGWYYRVIESGFIDAGDELQLVDRPSPDWTIRRAWRTFYVDTLNLDGLVAMSELAHLSNSWREYARKRLNSLEVEDRSRHLREI